MFNVFTVLYNKINPQINEKVGVKSNNVFARAAINKILDGTTYSVYYLDYGGVEHVKADNIFVLPFEFRQVCFLFLSIELN